MIVACIKRILRFLPYAGAFILALGAAVFSIVYFGEDLLFRDGTFSAVDVSVFVPEDTSVNGIGFAFISSLDSVEESVNFVQLKSPEEVRDSVAKGVCPVGIIIPDEFAASVMSGENLSLDVIFRSSDTFDEYVVNDILKTLARVLGSGQAATQVTYRLCDIYGAEISTENAVINRVSSDTLSYALSRQRLFKPASLDYISVHTVREKMTASYILYIMFLSVFIFSYFCKGYTAAFRARAKLSGYGSAGLFMIETLCVSVVMYFMFILIYIVLSFTPLRLSALSAASFIPFILIVSVIITGLTYIVKNPVYASYISFAAFTLLFYLAGGLFPLEFMPQFLQELSAFNPFTYLLSCATEALFI